MSSYNMLNEKMKNGIIKKLGWENLTSVQEKTIPEIIAGKNLIVLAPTAGGKTEAAFLPIINEVSNKELKAVSVLYISPIKALLNNQEERLKTLSSFIYEETFKWHGDVDRTSKKIFLKKPSQILMITPESLEVILMNTKINKNNLFGNLHYIVIDEIHALAESKRGVHLMALIERLQKYTSFDIQRIGLSATVGNPKQLLEWIQGSSKRDKKVVYPDKVKKDKKVEIVMCTEIENTVNEIYKRVFNRKALLFSNSRKDAEKFKLLLDRDDLKTHIHHSSINKLFREEAEDSFKLGNESTIIATNTLELGIDIGDLDIVLHLDSPSTVSSFLQKMGRTGRREGKISHFVFLPKTIEKLVLSIGIINLVLKNWVDDVAVSKREYDILLHQILTISLSEFGADVELIYETLKRTYSFSDISYDEYIDLLNYMNEEKLIFLEKGRSFIGENSEKYFGKMNFLTLYSTFETPKEFTVINKGTSIGTVESWYINALGDNANFLLAGKCWEINKIDEKRFFVYVIESRIADPPRWISGGKMISFELAQEFMEIITSNINYNFLNLKEQSVLDSYRYKILESGLKKDDIIVTVSKKEIELIAYFGDKINYTIGQAITLLDDNLEIKGVSFAGISIKKNKSEISKEDIESYINKIIESDNFFTDEIKNEIINKSKDISLSKFQKYLPENLRKKMLADYIYDFDCCFKIKSSS